MMMKILSWASLLFSLVLAQTALARDEIIELHMQGGLAIADSQGALHSVQLKLWDGKQPQTQPHPAIEVRSSKRTRRRGNDTRDCQWALASALKEIAHQARKLGADTLIDVRSNWKDAPNHRPGYYQCALGGWMVGVALRATAVVHGRAPAPAVALVPATAAQPPAQAQAQAAALAPAVPVAPAPSAVQTLTEQGKTTYQVVLGNPLVGAKLAVTPEADPERVRVTLAFHVEPAQAKEPLHKRCAVSGTAGGERLEFANTTYQRGAAQETLSATATLAQLRKLAASESSLEACDTHVKLREETRRELSQLVEVVDGHVRANQATPPATGQELSI
jgi:hypothetical protein